MSSEPSGKLRRRSRTTSMTLAQVEPTSSSLGNEANQISRSIDEELRREHSRRKDASKREIKVMLLGQGEAGKSTLRKQFQLYYASQDLDIERPSWRPVVLFNIIKAIRMIFDELDYQLASAETPLEDERIQTELFTIRRNLLPLLAIEDPLASELSGGISFTGGVYVRSGWQASVTPSLNWSNSDSLSPSNRVYEVTTLAAVTLADAVNHIEALWNYPPVKSLMQSRKLRLDESAPFFLDDIRRVAAPSYLPTTYDILHVRLQTLGVTEYVFKINMGGTLYNWLLYDVGGARGQRHAWAPYFEDATAIIFLTPISAFDQYLEEDHRTNRIDDSLQLFTSICSNKLLKGAQLILLLNKTDMLKKKLNAGIKVRKYIRSYGDRPNVYEDVSRYFRAHFLQLHERKDIAKRTLYVHFTSMLNIKASQKIIVDVGEAVIRSHIMQTGLI